MSLYPQRAEPVTKPAEPVAYNAPRALVSSSARLHLNKRSEVEALRQRSTTAAAWQVSAWECYDHVGEVNYAFNYAGSVLSRVRFHAAVVINQDAAPVDVGDAGRIKTDDHGSSVGTVNGIDPRLARLAAAMMQKFAPKGTAAMAKAFGLNVQVAGECYLACIDDVWAVKSTSELKIDAAGVARLYPSSYVSSIAPVRIKRGTPIGRIWNQHPRHSADADSSLRAVLSDCEELILLARLIRVTARARLNAGLLFVPDTMSASARTTSDGDDDDGIDSDPDNTGEDDDAFEKELFDAMTLPVSAEDNAAAIVPLLIRGPSEEGDRIKYIKIDRQVGDDLINRAKDVLIRVLQGINAPKELATGMSQSRYNNAKLIDEQSYKALVEPLALMFGDAVTDIFLRPMLRIAIEVEDWVTPEIVDDIREQVERIVCWYDPSEVTTSVDQSGAANDGWDRDVLSDSAWRKAHGFSDNDKPSERELAQRIALKQVSLPPDIINALLRVAFPTIYAEGQVATEGSNGVGLPPELATMLAQRGDGSVAPTEPVPATSAPQPVPQQQLVQPAPSAA